MAACEELRARLALAGPWQLAFDPRDDGIRGRWMAGNWPEAGSAWVEVPALWNVTHPDAEGVGFYRRVFAIPPGWQGKVLRLHFEGASYRAEVWLNGWYVGSHEGAYTPFSLDVTAAARVGGENELVVRVASLARACDVDGMPLSQCPASKQSWYYTHGGLWGEVYLEALPVLSCRAVAIEPDLERERILVEVAVENGDVESHRVDLHLEVARPDGSLAADEHSGIAVPPGVPRLSYRILLPRPVLWDCQNPSLHQLRVGVGVGGQCVDSRLVRFGMREFTVRDGSFFLNGKPIFLRGLLLQPDYPITSIVPPTREMMVREITLAREAGFNLIRAHIRPAPPGYLDLADEMGMLIYAESCLAWIKDSPRLLDHGRRELQAMIEPDRNHPSVVFWGIHNENRAASALTSEALIRFVRALDPTRVIVDNSGGTMAIDQDFGWVDRATVVPSRQTERQPIQDLHVYVGAPISAPVYEWLRTLGAGEPTVDMSAHGFGSQAMLEEWNRELRSYRGQVFVSELGCGGMADLDAVVAGYRGREDLCDAREMKAFRDSLYEGFAARRLDQVFGSVRGLIQATQQAQAAGLGRQVEALLANRRVSGFIVTQLNDVAWEFHAGILDHWRNPKPAYEAMKRLNRPQCLILHAASPVVTVGKRVEVALTLASRAPLGGTEQIQVTVEGPAAMGGGFTRAATEGAGIRDLGAIAVETGEAPGEWRVSARLVRGDETLAESTEAILALPPADLKAAAAQIRSLGDAPPAFAAGQEGGPACTREERRVWLAARPATLAERDWGRLLDAVAGGDVAIVGPLRPHDERALRLLRERGMNVRLDLGIGSWMGCFHWLRDPGLVAGLPGPGLAGEAYVDVLPWYVMPELGGDVLAGSLRNTQTRHQPPAMLWYSDVEAVGLGTGTMVFCQYRLFEPASRNPLAARLAYNLIRLAQRYWR